MKNKKFDAVEFKHQMQKIAQEKLSKMSEEEQLKFFKKKYGHLMKKGKKKRAA